MLRRVLPKIFYSLVSVPELRRVSAPGLASAAFDYPPVASRKAVPEPYFLQRRVVIYDGVCHLCHKGVKWVIKVDKDAMIKFCCLQSKAAEPYLLFCGVNKEDVQKRMLFVEGPDGYFEGSAAALKVASYLPFPYSAISALLLVPAPIRDAAYDYIAKRRYDWFGKADECIVMKEREFLERFIDRDEMMRGGPNDF
ncbi:hypothetical protein KFK09_011538 [Dendrobium nobile]|uniref:Thiol-disulfide oxidoreductase DCC n=1 Tax=Dendrobium nobile TaxID=94219 RepID=A0A8T3BFB5_DENNO|nr:hypothetical protein KFK09_011538 [Dendrobium nobile]